MCIHIYNKYIVKSYSCMLSHIQATCVIYMYIYYICILMQKHS